MRKALGTGEKVRRHFSTLARFAMVGGMNTVIDAALFFALTTAASMPPVHANVVSYSAGVLNSYIINRSWTFRGSPQVKHRDQFLRFALCNFLMLGLSSTIIWQTVPILGVIKAKLVSIIVTFAFGYLINRTFVFPGKLPENISEFPRKPL